VRHRRFRPVEHTFTFPLCLLYLDLGELPEVFRGSWLWSAERPALAWFRRRDHLGDPTAPLDRCVRDLVEEEVGLRPAGPIRLLTHPRYAGYAMNPVSLYYCFDRGGERVEALVAEVNNTPWGERHCYVMRHPRGGRGALRARTPKQLHVSPFMAMQLDYGWRVGQPGSKLGVRIANHEPDGAVLFAAVLALSRRELSARSRARALLRYPLMTAQVAGAIYWQALRLWQKGAPFHPRPRTAEAALENLS
jgi:hypothetical protein